MNNTTISYFYNGETRDANIKNRLSLEEALVLPKTIMDTFEASPVTNYIIYDFLARLFTLRVYTDAISDEMMNDSEQMCELVYECNLFRDLNEGFSGVNEEQWSAIQKAINDNYDQWLHRSKWDALADMGIGLLAKLDEALGGADLGGLVMALEQHNEQQETPEKGAQDAQEAV